MKSFCRGIAAVWLSAFLAGCDFGQHWISAPYEDRVIKTESGDRFYLSLEADASLGEKWSATCADPDIDVKIDAHPTVTKVEIRVHRGFDGPSSVTLRRTSRSGGEPKEFTLAFYKRIGDKAFWE